MLTEEEGADVLGEVEAFKVHKSERLMTKVQDYVGEVALSVRWMEWSQRVVILSTMLTQRRTGGRWLQCELCVFMDDEEAKEMNRSVLRVCRVRHRDQSVR